MINFESIWEYLLSSQLYFYAFLGAFVLYLLNSLHNHMPFSLFTGININIDKNTKPHIILLDMIISSIIGAVAVIPISAPSTVPQALLAGLGLTGILSVHSKSKETSSNSNENARNPGV